MHQNANTPKRTRKSALLSIVVLLALVGITLGAPALSESAEAALQPVPVATAQKASSFASPANSLTSAITPALSASSTKASSSEVLRGLAKTSTKPKQASNTDGSPALATSEQGEPPAGDGDDPAGGDSSAQSIVEDVIQTTPESSEPAAQEPEPAQPAPAIDPNTWPVTLTQTIPAANNKPGYTVRVTFDEASGIPHNSALKVSVVTMDEAHKAALRSALSVTDDQQVPFEGMLKISLAANGAEVQPTAPVTVEVESKSIKPAYSFAIEAAMPANAEAPIVPVENLSGVDAAGQPIETPKSTRVRMQLSKLGELGLAVVLAPKYVWGVPNETINVWVPRQVSADFQEMLLDEPMGEGLTLQRRLGVAADPATDWASNLWISTKPAEVLDEREFGGMHCYETQGEALGKELFGRDGTAKLVALKSGADYAFVWDTGYRNATIKSGDTSFTGLMPVGTKATMDDVFASFADAEAVVGVHDGVKFGYRTLWAQTLSFNVNSKVWQPDAEHTLTTAVPVDGVTASSEVQVWHVDESGQLAQTGIAQVRQGKATFPIQSDGTYILVERYTLDRVLTATDGATYTVTVRFDGSAGLPRNVVLAVSEIEQGSMGYFDCVSTSTKELGVTESQVTYAKALDISLLDPITGMTYEPNEYVHVTVSLTDDDKSVPQNVDVVHMQSDTDNQAEVLDSFVSKEGVEFAAEKFSVYVIVNTAISQKLTASDGNEYLVTVSYDSTCGIPENAELQVHELKEGDEGYAEYVATAAEKLGLTSENLKLARPFDITLRNPQTGEEYQPSKDVLVSIELLNDDLNTYTEVGVVHFAGAASGEADVVDTTVKGKSVEFETDGFSVFVLTGNNDTLCTYYFYAYNSFGEYQAYIFYDDQGNQVSSQTIKNGETLLAPSNPPRNPIHPEAEFKGWYKGRSESDLDPDPFDFSQPQAYTPDNRETSVDLYAVFADYAYVSFHGQYDSETQAYPVVKTKRVELDGGSGTISIDDVSVPYYDTEGENGFPEYTFYGWSKTPIPTAGEGQSDKIDGAELSVTTDTDLYPVFQKVHWLNLLSGNSGTGATYYAPVSVVAGDTLLEEEFKEKYIPSRPGYVFQGWYLDVANSGTDAQSGVGTQLTDQSGTFQSVEDFNKGIVSVAGEGAYLSLSKNVTIYAAWQPTQVSYSIVVWKQRATDADGLQDSQKTYDYVESFINEIAPSASIPVVIPTESGADPVAEGVLAPYEAMKDVNNYNATHPESQLSEGDSNPYEGYSLNGTKTLTDTAFDQSTKTYTGEKTVAYDGSTVFNLYYDKDSNVIPGTGTVSLTFHFVEEADGNDVIISNLEIGAPLSGDTSPTPGRSSLDGYEFGWYYDAGCTAPVSFATDTMPDHDVTIYGGWTKEWYLVKIDPNYGDLNGNGSTFFWKTFQSDYIQEYTWVTRNYIASESGSWYYVNHDYDYVQAHTGSDRLTYYTQDVAKATELNTFRPASGMYLYDGWYQVNADGTETPYEFGHLIEGNTALRLHWRMAGVFYLQYNADVTVGGKRLAGRISDGSIVPSVDGYADRSDIIVNNYADAPDGYTFIGWRVRGDDSGRVYHPGELLTLNGERAVTVNGKKTVYLDAVYATIKTASIVYDANGGTVSDTADSGYPYKTDVTGTPVMSGEKPENLNTHSVARTSTTLTVSGLVNNSPVLLSTGEGFSYSYVDQSGNTVVLEPSGWNTKPDGSGTHYVLGSYVDEQGKPYYVDIDDPVTLYAEWKIKAYFDENKAIYPGAAFSSTGWDDYTKVDDASDSHNGQYYIDTFVNALLDEPTGVVTAEGQFFDFWGTEKAGDQESAFDFSKTKLTGSQTLYAHLAGMVKVPYHVVSSNKVNRDEWRNTDALRVSATPIYLRDESSVSDYVTPESNAHSYEYACLSDSVANTNASNKVISLYLDQSNENKVTAELEDHTKVLLDVEGKDVHGRQIYLVYRIDNADQRVKLAYVKEGQSGTLDVINPVTYDGQPFISLNASIVNNHTLSSAIAANGVIEGDSVSGQVLTLNGEKLEVSQRIAYNSFNAPPLLDDPTDLPEDTLTLVYDKFGVGESSAGTVSALDGNAKKLYLRYYDGRRQWSLDGTEWSILDGDTLYVMYQERGSELVITKSVTGENTGISSDASFEVTVTSNAITRTSYKTEGTGYASVMAIPATDSAPGSISLTVKDGSNIHIQGLGNGIYTVAEKHNTNFTLQAKVENQSVEVEPTAEGDCITFPLEADTKADLLNVPFEICRVWNSNTMSYQTFYTLNKALEYIQGTLSGEGTIELLRDYVIPDWDRIEIPTSYTITLTSKSGNTWRILRDEGFTNGPLITNYGTLSLNNITLDGNSGKNVVSENSMISNSSQLTIGAGASLQNAHVAGAGAAISQDGGSLIVESGTAFTNNTADTNGGAISASSGSVVIKGGTFSGNNATNGGMVQYAGNETMTIEGGTFSGNSATNGGTVYAASGSIEVSGGEFRGDPDDDQKASAQNGGAIFLENAALALSGGTFNAIKAQQNGGAVYSDSGTVTLSGNALEIKKNTAVTGSGGAIYSSSGNINILNGKLEGNSAFEFGGAVYLGSGTLEMSNGTIGGTDATNTNTANSSQDGAGLYVYTGNAYLAGGSITGNVATEGGAVGVGSANARLYLSGGVKVTNNINSTLPSGSQKANIYLDQDSDDVISFTGLSNAAAVGIYVSDGMMDRRGVPGAKFASYTNDSNKGKVTNDRDATFAVVSDVSTKKLYWGKAISVVVRYQSKSFMSNGFPPRDANPEFKKTINPYYPVMGDEGYVALSSLAEDLYKNYDLKLSTTAAYACSFIREDPVRSFYNDYLIKLSWDKENSKWVLTKHDDKTKVDLGNSSLLVYYAEPAYISIENNTEMSLKVNGIVMGTGENAKSVINTDGYAGYGMTFAKNGAIRSALMPVAANDLVLPAGTSVTLLVPGGCDTDYTLTGTFSTGGETKEVQLRTTKSSGAGLDSKQIQVNADGSFASLTGKKTLAKAGTYQIIFGNDKSICKISTNTIEGFVPETAIENGEIVGCDPVEGTGKTEYLFSTLNKAVAFIKKYMSDTKTATIEMLVDYLLPASDKLEVPTGYNITLTTATTGVNTYTPAKVGEPRATISRDQENTSAMLTAKGNADNPAGTIFAVRDLIIDGKSVRGSSDGGAVSTKDCNVTVSHCKFLNIYAGNGGALFVAITDGKHGKGSSLTVEHSDFLNCYSTKTGSRDGGGAIHAYVDSMTLDTCNFTSCEADWQAGAVFHKVELKNSGSGTTSTVNNCTFTSCKSKAAGGLELGSHNIKVTGCTFEHCVATDRNGGGFNVYALNSAEPTVNCWTTVIDCSFDDCHVTGTNPGNGGGFRSTSKYTTIVNTTFNNTSSKFGGAVALSSKNAAKAEIYGCSINGGRASDYGGGVYSLALDFKIGDGYYYLDSENRPVTVLKTTEGDAYKDLSGNTVASIVGGYYYLNDEGTPVPVYKDGDEYKDSEENQVDANIVKTIQSRHTEIKNCIAAGKGGGVYHNRDANGATLTVENATITGNTSTGYEGGGVAIYRVRSATFTGCTISNNTAKGDGGGIWIGENNVTRTLVIDSSTIEKNTSSGVGGGIYSYANLTLRNNTTITGNRITTSPADASTNAGGVYIPNDRTLTVGTDDAVDLDSTTVKNNTIGSGAPSDLRLWWDASNKNSKATSVNVRCSLNGEIRVVNPGKALQQFGTRVSESCEGFTEGSHVFVADSGGLYGVFNRADPLKLIWRGGIVCKITDSNGHLLYLDENCKDPAVFDRLDYRTDGSMLSPLSYLRQNTPLLYREGETNPVDLETEEIKVKLLVSTFETETHLVTGSYNTRKLLTLTTASNTDTDGYPYTGRAGTYATIKRAYTDNGKSLLDAKVNLTLTNITLDGGSTDKSSPRTTTANGGLINANSAGITITLAANSVLQNCRISNGNHGGGVYINGGASLTIAGGAIYNCSTATGNGGGVWKTGGGALSFTSGNISQCSANNGGGVHFENGTSFDMSGSARITGCTATNQGGGVFLNAQKTMNMSGGTITGNHAGSAGGGIFLGNNEKTRLYLSNRVTVSGNTAVKDGKTVACNVELVTDSNDVINSLGIARNSNIGVYVPGVESPGDTPAEKNTSQYDKHGLETKPFGKFANGSNTDFLYCFINDRNGLKGGLQLGDNEKIHWVRIFSLHVEKTVISGVEYDLEETFTFKVTFSKTKDGVGIYDFNSYFTYNDQFDEHDEPITTPITDGVAEFTLKNGESVTVDNLPAEIDNGNVYYKVEEKLATDRAQHYTTTTYRSSGTSGDHSVSGTIGENLYREDVTSKYTSFAYFDNLNAVCKLTSSKNGGVLLYTLDDLSEKLVPAVYSSLHGNSNDGAFDVVNSKQNLYYFNAFTDRYEMFDYDGSETLSVEMLVGTYDMKRAVTVNKGSNVTLTTAKSNATDGYPYVGTPGTSSEIIRKFNNQSMFTATGNLALTNITLDGNKYNFTANTNGGIVNVDAGALNVQDGAVLKNSKTTSYGGGAIRVGSNNTSGTVLVSGTAEIFNNEVVSKDANGGAISVKQGTVTIEGGRIYNNQVKNRPQKGYGGAVYVEKGTLNLSGGTITGNTVPSGSTCDGAGIYLGSTNVTMNISGAPNFKDDELGFDGNYKSGTLTGKTNGGEEYSQARQDIFVAEVGTADSATNKPSSIVVTGDLTGDAGSIWVWASNQYRYKQLMPFAKLGLPTGTTFVAHDEANGKTKLDADHLKVFRNARDDETTENQTDTYLFGTIREDTPGYVCWSGLAGYDVKFKKIDGYGNAQDAAVFTLFTDAACTTKLEVAGVEVTGTSSSGVVSFNNKIPSSVYYMTETTVPSGYTNTNTYIVLVGDKALSKEDLNETSNAYLSEITTETIAGQTNLYKAAYKDDANDYDKYAIFLINKAAGKAITTPNIAADGIMNTSDTLRKVILRKVGNNSQSLAGAKFRFYNADWTARGNTEYETNDKTGVYFIDTLPYGTYYLRETVFPNGYSPADYDASKWYYYRLTVGAEGYQFTKVAGGTQKLDAKGAYIEGLFSRDAITVADGGYNETNETSGGYSGLVAQIERTGSDTWPNIDDVPQTGDLTTAYELAVGRVYKDSSGLYYVAIVNETLNMNMYNYKSLDTLVNEYKVCKLSENTVILTEDNVVNENGQHLSVSRGNVLLWKDDNGNSIYYVAHNENSWQLLPPDSNWIRILVG